MGGAPAVSGTPGFAPALPASPYAGRRIALLTRHGKERVVAPLLRQRLGAEVHLDGDYDTDRLGTFTRDIPRLLGQRETAARKARIAIERTGLPLGLGSEGAFGRDPVSGLLPWNVELVVLVDAERDIEVAGMDQGPTRFGHLSSGEWAEVERFARDQGFPRQQLVVRPAGEDDPRITKGIASWPGLEAAFARALEQADNGRAFVETDGRAHASPERMARIQRATADLVERLLCRCPACGTPGFAMVERIPGLPCAACGAPTRETRAEVHGCLKCAHRVSIANAGSNHADPGRCDGCNP